MLIFLYYWTFSNQLQKKRQTQSKDKDASLKSTKVDYIPVGKKIVSGEGTNKDLETNTHENLVEEPLLEPKEANKNDLTNMEFRGTIQIIDEIS